MTWKVIKLSSVKITVNIESCENVNIPLSTSIILAPVSYDVLIINLPQKPLKIAN